MQALGVSGQQKMSHKNTNDKPNVNEQHLNNAGGVK
jgi:hypothetical protein